MALSVPHVLARHTSGSTRGVLLVAAVVRAAIAALAIGLAPFLYREHAAVLVLLRPTKEVFLFAGFLMRRGDVTLPPVVAAALPVLLGGVWIFFGLGRSYRKELAKADLPGIAGRVLPPKRIQRLRDTIEDRGMRLVFLGRLAAFPSSLTAAAAGSSDVPVREFLIADAAGAFVSLAAALALGFGLGEAYESGGAWLTAVGVVVLAAVAVMVGRTLSSPRRSRSS